MKMPIKAATGEVSPTGMTFARAGVFACPSDRLRMNTTNCFLSYVSNYYFRSDYRDADNKVVAKINQIRHQSSKIYMGDVRATSDSTGYGSIAGTVYPFKDPSSYTRGPDFRHDNFMNILWADMHVAPRNVAALYLRTELIFPAE